MGTTGGGGGGAGVPAGTGGSGNYATGDTPSAKTVDYATPAASAPSDSPSAELPVLLAIGAVIVLTLVAAGYVRLVMLRREPS